MIYNWQEEYKKKLTTADEAVKLVQDGARVYYPQFVMKVPELDAALARRVKNKDVKDIRLNWTTLTYVPEVMKADPTCTCGSFTDGSFSAATRAIKKQGIPVFAAPTLYHESGTAVKAGVFVADVLFLSVTPMDKNGYFQMGIASSNLTTLIEKYGREEKTLTIIVEINDKLPHVHGDNFVHISEVAAVVEEKESEPLMEIPPVPFKDIDVQIAKNVIAEIEDGACLQLGIGALPNAVGKMIAQSDLQDLGCHTEMLVDAYLDIFKAGKLTNARKKNNKGKSVFTFAMGTKELYDFVDNNPACECREVGYCNDPYVIAENDKVISICSCISVDMLGNVSSESVGYKQISATGGAWDYHFASLRSKGGKGFMCLPSVTKDKEGKLHSNIVARFEPGTQITVAANTVNYIVTEYGVANLKMKNTKERVDELLKVCHPDFREELKAEALKAGIWRP